MVLRVQNKTRNIIKTMKQNKISITRTNEMKTDKFIYNKQKKKRTLFLELFYKTDSFFFIFQSFFYGTISYRKLQSLQCTLLFHYMYERIF